MLAGRSRVSHGWIKASRRPSNVSERSNIHHRCHGAIVKRVHSHQRTSGPDVRSRDQVWTLGIDLPTGLQVTPGPESILLQKGKHLARVFLQISVSAFGGL